MNVRLKCNYYPKSSLFLDGKFFIACYAVNLLMITQSTDTHKQNIALKRINHMMEYEFDNTVFINHSETKQIKLFQAAGLDVTTLPQDPIDQIIGLMLYHKLNAVTEKIIHVHEVEISSDLGRDIVYCHSSNEVAKPLSEPGWWHDSSPMHRHKSKNKEVVLDFANNWSSLGLDWEPQIFNNDTSDNKVVFGAFRRDES